jgi:hypothetical protein
MATSNTNAGTGTIRITSALLPSQVPSSADISTSVFAYQNIGATLTPTAPSSADISTSLFAYQNIGAAAPTLTTFDANTIPVDAFVVPAIDAPCRLDREDTEKNRARKGSSLAARIRKITQDIENETDCLALQQKIRKELKFIEDFIDEQTKEIQRKLDEILPVLSIPLNPFKIPKWLKKMVIGRILPDLDATIDFMLRAIELAKAITNLIEVIVDLAPKLEACAIGTINDIKNTIQNEIDQAIADIQKQITDAIGEAICGGLREAGISANDINDVLSAVGTVNNLVRQVGMIGDSLNTTLGNNLTRLGENQSLIQDITGLPPVIDTSSLEAFEQTGTSEAYAQYRIDVINVLNQPDPVNSDLPTVTGSALVGSTLTCSNGTWTSNGVVTTYPLLFQWFRDNQEIAAANTFQYVPTINDVEYPLTCRVTADAQVAIEEAFTAPTSPVQFSMAPGNMPTISGSAIEGQTLQCSEGTWPYDPTTVMYEWIRVPELPIYGANVRVQTLSANNLYTIKSGDVGNMIVCKVVASAFRYTLSVTTSNTAIIV